MKESETTARVTPGPYRVDDREFFTSIHGKSRVIAEVYLKPSEWMDAPFMVAAMNVCFALNPNPLAAAQHLEELVKECQAVKRRLRLAVAHDKNNAKWLGTATLDLAGALQDALSPVTGKL